MLAAQNYGKVLERIFDDVEIRLYGSYHRNAATKDSDIDLAVISPDFRDMNYLLSLKILNRLKLGVDLDIEPISLTPEEFQNPLIGSIAYSVAKDSETVFTSAPWF
ncbi:MAG: nucleotidyltransferase domain-containing protein [Oligoflexia bacterium]|nr:nucleotidyltransferase domain-containing protein [Oligoflexia bacterium]